MLPIEVKEIHYVGQESFDGSGAGQYAGSYNLTLPHLA